MAQQDIGKVLVEYADAVSASTGIAPDESRAQAFRPTGYPSKISVAPGVVMVEPKSYAYAPDIEVADRKICEYTAAARMGKLAVINVSIEPGSGKTFFLPFKFTSSRCLVVLPTAFDAWSAYSVNTTNVSNIWVYGTKTTNRTTVTYTDSYHAAYLLTTGAIKQYFDMVFVDESHSQEAVTSFMASVALPGVVFIRMTASPSTTNSVAKKSFQVMRELDVPDFSDRRAVTSYVNARNEHRVLVMAPTASDAASLAGDIKDSVLVTRFSPISDMVKTMSQQSVSSRIITDETFSKGTNLNLDCTIDFAKVETPSGVRSITQPEQLQRQARVGRSKPGVYCCSYTPSTNRVVDHYSTFRSNLWFIVNGLKPYPCDFPDVSPERAFVLLGSMTEPALVPTPANPTPVATPVMSYVDDAYDSGDSADSEQPATEPVGSDLVYTTYDVQDEDPHVHVVEREFTQPSWYAYYVEGLNHPMVYVADMVHEHRQVHAPTLVIDKQVTVAPAPNRRAIDHAAPPQRPSPAPPLNLPHTELPVRASIPHLRGKATSRVGLYRDPARVSARDDSPARNAVVKLGSTSHSTVPYKPVVPLSSLGRAPTLNYNRDLVFDGIHLGGPLHLIRATKSSRTSRGTSYAAASLCGGYITIFGMILSSGHDMHRGLAPLHREARHALHEVSGSSSVVDAAYYLTWTKTVPYGELPVQQVVHDFKVGGAWAVPPVNVVPSIDLELEYNPAWVDVMTSRIRNKLPLPRYSPRHRYEARSRRARIPSDTDVLILALDHCSRPSYTATERYIVYKAWNLLAVQSASVGFVRPDVYVDASILLGYMASADMYSDYDHS